MSPATALLIAIAMAITGCTIVPVGTANQACQLLNTASAEADLAPAWYERAGEVLAACGQPDAKKDADARACAAEKRNRIGLDIDRALSGQVNEQSPIAGRLKLIAAATAPKQEVK